MDSDAIFRQKKLLKDVVDNPLFDGALKEVRAMIIDELMLAPTSELREELYFEAKLLYRLNGRLRAIANDVSMTMVKRNG